MIWESKACVVVMLTRVFDFVRVMCTQYWPTENHRVVQHGNITVTLLREDTLANFTLRALLVKQVTNVFFLCFNGLMKKETNDHNIAIARELSEYLFFFLIL